MDKLTSSEEFSIGDGQGKLKKSLDYKQILFLWILFFSIFSLFIFRTGQLQIAEGGNYRVISENNTFVRKTVFPIRGDIYDREGVALAWNTAENQEDEFPKRNYYGDGFSSLLGFINYPKKDSSGNYYLFETEGVGGIEKIYNDALAGSEGSLVLERDAVGNLVSELYIEKSENGENIAISVDSVVQDILFKSIRETAIERGFKAGSGVVLDINTGEIISLASYPEFNNDVLTNSSSEDVEKYIKDQEDAIFVNRAISGLYSPGSTIKPFFAIAALEEGVVKETDIIVSNGYISIQNPYDEDIEYRYTDRKAFGPIDIYDAIAHSSNVFFYYIGGGYGNKYDGLGIDRLNAYANIFGFEKETSLGVFNEPSGLVPDVDWKYQTQGEEWRIGDTYNTVIGQYSFQVTPLQLARAVSAIANGGYLVEPHFEKDETKDRTKLFITDKSIGIVKNAMRQTILRGTARILNSSNYEIAAKTGTAQIGGTEDINSMLIGFFPYDNPKYSFAIVMERGDDEGAAIAVSGKFFNSLSLNADKYFK